MHISKVGHIFVGETEQYLSAPSNDYRSICTFRYKVGEIDLKWDFKVDFKISANS